MAFSLEALSSEIAGDPQGYGYAAMVSAGNDTGLAAALNLPRAGISVREQFMSGSDFQLAALPAILAIDGLSGALNAKWNRIFAVLNASEVVRLSHPSVQALFAAAVTDGLMTQQQADSIGTRTGSRAEQLFGAGVVVTSEQCGAAR